MNNITNDILIAANQRKEEHKYWMQKLSGNLGKTYIPFDFKEEKLFRKEVSQFALDLSEYSSIFKIFGGSEQKIFLLLYSLLNITINKYTGLKDIVITTTIRKQATNKNLINKILFLRNTIDKNQSFKDVLKEVTSTIMDGFKNQNYPSDLLLNKIQGTDDKSKITFSDIAFILNGFQDIEYLDGYQFDVVFFFNQIDEKIVCDTYYNGHKYEKTTIQNFNSYFEMVLSAFNENMDSDIAGVNVLSNKMKSRILYEFNNTETPFCQTKNFNDLFLHNVELSPDRIAVSFRDKSLTYSFVNKRSQLIANYLYFSKNCSVNQAVACLLERSDLLIVSMVGIMKAECTYVPIDGSLPNDRIEKIIQDAQVEVIISEKKFLETLYDLQYQCYSFKSFICIDSHSIYDEVEPKKAQMAEQQKFWEDVGGISSNLIEEGGWYNSFNGETFSKNEIDEYVENVYEKLSPYLNKDSRVLEIGCASGFTMFRLAPLVKYYRGIDYSKVIIQKVQERLQKKGITNIKLANIPAHEIDLLDENDFNVIILNSVIQDFAGYNYLREVLIACLNIIQDEGFIFLGDIMDPNLKQQMINDLQKYKQKHQNTRTKLYWNAELFVSKLFLKDLHVDFPEIETVQFSKKLYTIENELTKYRYDAILKIDKKQKDQRKGKKLKYQEDERALINLPENRMNIPGRLDNISYIIFTSGTTGQPKGALIQQSGMLNHFYGNINYLSIDSSDTIAQIAPVSFDISIWQCIALLMVGAKVCVIDNEDIINMDSFLKRMEDHRITVLEIVPTYMKILLNRIGNAKHKYFKHLKWLMPTGEKIEYDLIKKWYEYFPAIPLVNAYGPAEASDDVTLYTIPPGYHFVSTPVGKPIDNTHIYIYLITSLISVLLE